MADLLQSKQQHIEICYPDVQWQSGVSDCGLFAIAFATSICFGRDPTTAAFTQRDMRSHLLSCIKAKKKECFSSKKQLSQTETSPMVHKWYNVHRAKNGSTLHVYAYHYTFLEMKKTTGPALTNCTSSFVDIYDLFQLHIFGINIASSALTAHSKCTSFVDEG